MGKSKTHKINTHLAASMALGDQINEGRVAKNKLKNPKIRLRAEEEGVSSPCNSLFHKSQWLIINQFLLLISFC